METRVVVDVSGAPATSPARLRNPGPSWGFQFLRIADRVLPEFLYRPLRALGTWVALAGMPRQRGHSRDYLRVILGREPRLMEVFRHFFTFEEALMLKLRVANGRHIPCEITPSGEDFNHWLQRGGPALLGTMHVGVSDQLGFQLVGQNREPIHLVRQRVANSHDTDALSKRFGDRLRIIWINDQTEMLFALKDAAAQPGAIALQCDRLEHSARAEPFEFLGARRLFPFSIYTLALIFGRPVYLTVGIPLGPDRTQLHGAPEFGPIPGETRAAAMERARAHFQGFLRDLERILRANPYLWFNFLPLNPPEK